MSENFFIDSSYEYVKPEDFISGDAGNNIVLGTDKKLMVRTVASSGGSGKSVSITISDVKAGEEIEIYKDVDLEYTSAGVLNVWEYKDGATEIITALDYSKANMDAFIENEFIEFTDTGVKLKTEYTQPMEYVGNIESLHVYSTTIDLNRFKKFEVR